MAEVSVDLNSTGIREVLADLAFPASVWQIVAHADHWGASLRCVSELTRLPLREYGDLAEVVRGIKELRRGVSAPGPGRRDPRSSAQRAAGAAAEGRPVGGGGSARAGETPAGGDVGGADVLAAVFLDERGGPSRYRRRGGPGRWDR